MAEDLFGKNLMKTSIRHFGISVKNLNSMQKFFVNDLGFKVLRKMYESGVFIEKILNLKNVKVTTVKLRDENNNIIELLKFHNYKTKYKNWRGKVYTIGPTHIALNTKDIDLFFSKNKKKLKFNSPPEISPDGKAKVTFCNGPENLVIEIVEMIN
tara:strand:+ start:259 stop:723 length:465 start_codon:yes stop_codon:yes gene_type:complete